MIKKNRNRASGLKSKSKVDSRPKVSKEILKKSQQTSFRVLQSFYVRKRNFLSKNSKNTKNSFSHSYSGIFVFILK